MINYNQNPFCRVSYCFRLFGEFTKVFERQVRVAHLHSAARALSSPSRCFQLSTNLDKDFFRYLWYWMSFNVALVKFHWFGINWDVFNQSECRNFCLHIVIQKNEPQDESGKYFQLWFSPIWGKKWRRSEHAHASYPGLAFRSPGFSPYMGREERRIQGLDWSCYCFIIVAAVIVLWLGGIVSVVWSIVLSKGFKPVTRDLTRAAT